MDPMVFLLGIFAYVVFLVSVSIHDLAQTWVAWKLGDPTSKMLGRFTMNPMKHFDLWGMGVWPALDLFVFHVPFVFGWSTPIPVTSRNLRKPRRDENLIYIAGPIAQLLGAVVCLVLLLILKHLSSPVAESLDYAIALAQHEPIVANGLPSIFPIVLLLYFGILNNVVLFVFNLVPLPLFDGGKIVRNYLSYNAQKTFDSVGIYVTMGFLMIGLGIVVAFAEPVLAVFVGVLRTF